MAMSLSLTSRVALGARPAVKATKSTRRAAIVARAEMSVDEPVVDAAVAAPPVSMKDSFLGAMSFGGWAPETINGRVAQIAFVAGLGAELSTGESFTAQFAHHVPSIVVASGLITLASFMPNMQNTDEYKANPTTFKNIERPFTVEAERTNGRGAMVGLVAMFIVEKLIGGPITGTFSSSDDELFTSTFYDESFAAQVEAPAAAPVSKFVDFDSAVVAPAPVAEEQVEAVAAYEAAEAAEPLRVEGAVDAVVEEEAMAMGRAVSMAEDAM